MKINEVKELETKDLAERIEAEVARYNQMKLNHSRLPHGGVVIRSGRTGRENENRHVIEFKLDLDSNPEFTSSVLVAYARAAYRMHNDGISGAKTVFDIPPSYLHPDTPESQRKRLL